MNRTNYEITRYVCVGANGSGSIFYFLFVSGYIWMSVAFENEACVYIRNPMMYVYVGYIHTCMYVGLHVVVCFTVLAPVCLSVYVYILVCLQVC